MKKFILASNSPRRKEILKNAGFNFDIQKSNYKENISNLEYSDDLIINCAYNKGLNVFKKFPDEIIVSSDTVVVFNNTILGKPKNYNDAFDMLKKLSDNKHFVATAISVLSKNYKKSGIQKTNVTFKKLSDEDIKNYLDAKKPFDKAGSYGIQDEGFDFVTKLDGEIDNVIGFPMNLFTKLTAEL